MLTGLTLFISGLYFVLFRKKSMTFEEMEAIPIHEYSQIGVSSLMQIAFCYLPEPSRCASQNEGEEAIWLKSHSKHIKSQQMACNALSEIFKKTDKTVLRFYRRLAWCILNSKGKRNLELERYLFALNQFPLDRFAVFKKKYPHVLTSLEKQTLVKQFPIVLLALKKLSSEA